MVCGGCLILIPYDLFQTSSLGTYCTHRTLKLFISPFSMFFQLLSELLDCTFHVLLFFHVGSVFSLNSLHPSMRFSQNRLVIN